jgi:hypothetical protein
MSPPQASPAGFCGGFKVRFQACKAIYVDSTLEGVEFIVSTSGNNGTRHRYSGKRGCWASFREVCQMGLRVVDGCCVLKDFSQVNKNMGLPRLPSSAD